MEHRCSVRKPVGVQVLLYKYGLPVQSGMSRDLGLGGIFVETANRSWRRNESLEVEFLDDDGHPVMRLPALVAHQRQGGVGLMFSTVSGAQRSLLRGMLFKNTGSRPAAAPRAVA